MLKSVLIRSFKSLDEVTLHLAEISVLIGANAAGKTNMIEALMLLKWLAHGRQLSELPFALENELKLRGRLEDLISQDTVRFACTFESGHVLDFVLELSDGRVTVWQETLSAGRPVPLFAYLTYPQDGGHDVQVSYDNFARGGIKPQITCTNQQMVFTQLLTPARFGARHARSQEEIPAICRMVRDSLQSFFFLVPVTHRMRGYAFPTNATLNSDGSNLSGVVFSLPSDDQERILELVRALPEQNIQGLTFLHGPRGEVVLQLVETFGGEERPVDANLLSDGTLRVLAIGAALLSVPRGSTVVIEEMDNGVHPSRVEALLNGINNICRHKGIRTLATTHNPALLDGLPFTAVPNITFCYRDPRGFSEFVRLQDMPDYVSLLAQGSLGQILARGRIDHYAKHPTTAEETKEQGRQLLSALREEP